jgi:hypothetical protein
MVNNTILQLDDDDSETASDLFQPMDSSSSSEMIEVVSRINTREAEMRENWRQGHWGSSSTE